MKYRKGNMMGEKVSIIVPIYKVEKYIKKCVESILCQTYENLELILVDDGSPDECPQICDEYSIHDRRVKVIHKKNGGLSDARNAGINAATGQYLMFVDSDDYIQNNMVETLYSAVKSTNADLALCDINFVDIEGHNMDINTIRLQNEVWDETHFWCELYGKNYTACVVAWNKLYNKSIFEGIRFDVGKLHEDEFIIHKIVNQCRRIVCVNERLYNYLQRSNSIMGNSYSIRRLDIVEALMGRVEYFLSKYEQGLAELAFKYSVGFMMKGYENLDMREKTNVVRFHELKKQYAKMYFKIASRSRSPKFIINGFSFILGPRVYKVTRRIKLFKSAN